MLDNDDIPRVNFRPDLVDEFKTFPRVIYHSCDKNVVSHLIQNGFIPVGWPRARNHFIAAHPWDAKAGTRASKPFYVAVDFELAMQVGHRLFRTDEAILTPDWVPNECIICVYNAADGSSFWSNRAYAPC
jgi:RNA:NAD 2'-phosphotransferase (TPT1/KptA family)